MSARAAERSRAIEAVRCPRCGGTPDPSAGPGRLARCASCGVLGRLSDPLGGQQRLVVEPAIDEAFAWDALGESAAAPGISMRGGTCELIYVPFWRVRTTIIGRVTGEKQERTRDLEKVTLEDGQTFWKWIEKEGLRQRIDREVQKQHVAVVTACPLDELGLPSVGRHRQTGLPLPLERPLERLGRLSVFDPALRERATVLDPIVGRPQAEREAGQLLDRWRSGLGRDLERLEAAETATLARSTVLLFYPLYLLRIPPSAGRGTALIDAGRGRLVARRHPGGAERHDALGSSLTALGLGFAGGAALRALALGTLGAGAWWPFGSQAGGLTLGGAAAAALVGWSFARRRPR